MQNGYEEILKKSSSRSVRSKLIQEYGEDRGIELHEKAGKRLLELLESMDDRGNEAVRKHLVENILPAVSYYQVLREEGIGPEEAKALVTEPMQAFAKKAAKVFRTMSHIPFFYALFRRMIHKNMSENYPSAGWDMRWQQDDEKGVGFDCHRCIYFDTMTALGCPELCESFCQNDAIMFGGLEPKVNFVRTTTLATGGDRCDFRFLNGKHAKRSR